MKVRASTRQFGRGLTELCRCPSQVTSSRSTSRWPPESSSTSFAHDRYDCRRRSEEHTSELQSPCNLVCRLLLEKKKQQSTTRAIISLSSSRLKNKISTRPSARATSSIYYNTIESHGVKHLLYSLT